MEKSIFILFVAVIFANHIFAVPSQNCSEQQQEERTDNCTFKCIEVLYEKKFCSGVPTGPRIIPVQPNENDIFGSLMQYNVIGYNASSERVLSTGPHHGCENQDGKYERFFQPIELIQFFNCSRNLTVKSNDSEVDCTTDGMSKLYESINQRYADSQKWCMEALGIRSEFDRFKDAVKTPISPKDDSQNSTDSGTTNKATVENQTTEGETTAASTDSTIDPANIPNKEVENKNVTEETPTRIQNQTSSTESSTTSTTELPGATTKSSKKKVPSAPEHHFNSSIFVIIAMVGVILAIMIVSGIVLSVYVNRRKRMEVRTDSRTYVFDTRE